MFNIGKFLTVIMAGLLLYTASLAQDAPAYPPLVQTLAEEGAQIRYLGRDLGLDGWLTVKSGQAQYLYVTPNGQAYIMGLLFDKDGQMVTQRQILELPQDDQVLLDQFVRGLDTAGTIPSPTQKTGNPVEDLYNDLEESNWFRIGNATAPQAYVFIDPDCDHCHNLVNQLQNQNYFAADKLALRLIPVGIQGPDALRRAAFLIGAPRPDKLFLNHINGDLNAIPVAESISLNAVEKNLEIMQQWKLDVTPFIIYKDKNGTVKIIRGIPNDLDSFVQDIK